MHKIKFNSLTEQEQNLLFNLDSTPTHQGIFGDLDFGDAPMAYQTAANDIAYNRVPYSMDTAAALAAASPEVQKLVAEYKRPVTGQARFNEAERKSRGEALRIRDQKMVGDPHWAGTVGSKLAAARLKANEYGR